MQTILVTGGAGFIGSNFIICMLDKQEDLSIVNFDVLTYAGNLAYLTGIGSSPRYSFVKGDICDRVLLEDLFDKYRFSAVVYFAAESHVDRSITEPDVFLKTNILGTQVLLVM